jgi:hypothetical protein
LNLPAVIEAREAKARLRGPKVYCLSILSLTEWLAIALIESQPLFSAAEKRRIVLRIKRKRRPLTA